MDYLDYILEDTLNSYQKDRFDNEYNSRYNKNTLGAAAIGVGSATGGALAGKGIKDLIIWKKLNPKQKMNLYYRKKKNNETFAEFEKRYKREAIKATTIGVGVSAASIRSAAFMDSKNKKGSFYNDLKKKGILEEYQMYELGYNDAYNDIMNEMFDYEDDDELDYLY